VSRQEGTLETGLVERLGFRSWAASLWQQDEQGLCVNVEFANTRKGARKALIEIQKEAAK